jgi:Domain of unknown function (DUF4278)
MRLTYRGVTYDRQPDSLEMVEGETGGKYRGSDWHYHYPRHILNLQPKVARKYRGVAYGTPSVAYNSEDKGINPYLAKPQVKTSLSREATNIHLENIRQNLERRLKAAEASGDRSLIDLLEEESRQLLMY